MSITVDAISSSTNNDKLSDYERQRLENIMEIHGQYGELFGNVRQSAEELAKPSRSSTESNGRKCKRNSQKVQKSKEVSKRSRIVYVRRSARIIHENRPPTDKNEQNDEDNTIIPFDNGSVCLKFSWFKNNSNQQRDKEYYNSLTDSDFINSDNEEQIEQYNGEPHSKRTRICRVYTPRLAVSQVTQKMLKNIKYNSSGKKYSADGTTCHQCRQKTLDQKSYCRYKGCKGVRGMFCGFCLGKRYGEDVAEVLLNPKWACPPCRGYCNCSICRRKEGRDPTGQLAQQASANGYKSVRHMLSNLEGENPEKTISTEFENNDNENNMDEQSNISEGNNNNEPIVIEIQLDNVATDQSKTDNLNDETANDDTEKKMSH